MSVSKGSLVAVVGTVGSGKSSLLSAMMGEMEKDEGNVNIDGSVAYVPQQAWIQNQTLKDNVLFGHAYREDTYNDVIDACALRKDLEILPGKDMTEIGEKGINLSGGQKQRVSMARAVYFNADIYLLDDPLSAVDAHVGKNIFDHVISENGLLRNKTRILVTHGITWLPCVDQIFVVDKGRITETGTYQQLIDNDGEFAAFIKKYKTDGQLSDDDECKSDDGSSSLDSGYTSDVKASCSTSSLTSSQTFRRSISRSISIEEKSEKQHKKICTLDDEEKEEAKQIERETDKVQAGKLIDEEEIETGEVKLKYLVPYFKSFGLITGILILLSFLGWRGSEVATRILIKEWTGDSALSNITALPGTL